MWAYFGCKSPSFYNGLRIKADLGLHEEIAEVLVSNLPKGARILDLGAGEGALSERLSDLGFNVLAVDKNEQDFKSKKVPFQKVDFNDKMAVDHFVSSNKEAFDSVISVEVIEHVEDQWAYVRQLLTLTKSGGLVLITTPNITSWLSRVIFFSSGRFHQFLDTDLHYGHINPICPWRLKLILQQCGAQDIKIESAGTLPPIYFGGNKIMTRLALGTLSILLFPFNLLMRGIKNGWCVMALAHKL